MIRETVNSPFALHYRPNERGLYCMTCTTELQDLWTGLIEVAVDKVVETGEGERVEVLWSQNFKKFDMRGLRAWVGVGPTDIPLQIQSAHWISEVLKPRHIHHGRKSYAINIALESCRPRRVSDVLFVDFAEGDDRRSGLAHAESLKTYEELARRKGFPGVGEVYIQELSPWGARFRRTDRHVSIVTCPKLT